ncbi:uncharacterized protein CCDC7 [Engystomops pustulosus]|uniref:uncharacterized protein CCDC7 n=1 Tax=Engystomops pustulosus TaxID=76066 RepID=UPI003AFA505A
MKFGGSVTIIATGRLEREDRRWIVESSSPIMNSAKVNPLNTLRPKPPIPAGKTTHLNPIKRKKLKSTTPEYLPMVLLPPPEAESLQQYAVPLIGYGRTSQYDDVTEMWKICNRIDEYSKELENLYGKRDSKVSAKSLQMERLFFSFVSTCDSATKELDTKIDMENKILESLYQGYEKEVSLLEQLIREDITADSDIQASHLRVTSLMSKLNENHQKLEGIKHFFQNIPNTNDQELLLASPSNEIEEKRQGVQRVRKDLKPRWNGSKESMEKLIHDVGQLYDAQTIELQKRSAAPLLLRLCTPAATQVAQLTSLRDLCSVEEADTYPVSCPALPAAPRLGVEARSSDVTKPAPLHQATEDRGSHRRNLLQRGKLCTWRKRQGDGGTNGEDEEREQSEETSPDVTGCKRLGKDQEETKNEYIKVKTKCQSLLQEKKFLEIELKKLQSQKAGQKSPPLLTHGLKDGREKDIETISSPQAKSSIQQESERKVAFSSMSEEETEEVPESQKEATSADSPVSGVHKKAKIKKKRDTDSPEITNMYDPNEGDRNADISPTSEPGDSKMLEPKENLGSETKTLVSSSPNADIKGKDSKGKMKKRKGKSQKSRGKRPSTASIDIKVPKDGGRRSSKVILQGGTPSEKPEDKSLTGNKKQQDPETVKSGTKERKSIIRLSRTISSSGKGKAMLNEEASILTPDPSIQPRKSEESGPQQEIPGGPMSSKSMEKQQGGQQSLGSRSSLLSSDEEEKSGRDKQKEDRDEKQTGHKKVHDDRFRELPGVMESVSKGNAEPGRKDNRMRSDMEESDVITQDSGGRLPSDTGQALEDPLDPGNISMKTFVSAVTEFVHTHPLDTYDRTSENMDFPGFQEQSTTTQHFSADESFQTGNSDTRSC